MNKNKNHEDLTLNPGDLIIYENHIMLVLSVPERHKQRVVVNQPPHYLECIHGSQFTALSFRNIENGTRCTIDWRLKINIRDSARRGAPIFGV